MRKAFWEVLPILLDNSLGIFDWMKYVSMLFDWLRGEAI
jgi:hypothetical protein